VVRRFGRVLVVEPRAGLWIGLPWPFDRVDLVPIEKLRRVSIGYRPGVDVGEDAPPGQLLTGDRNLVNVAVVLTYTVDPESVVSFVEQQERGEDMVARVAEATLAEWIGSRTIDDVLLRGKTSLPADLPALLRERIVPLGLGVRVRGIDVGYLAPPDEVKPAFDNVAEAEARRRTTEQQAREEAQTKEREAEAKVRKMDLDGDAYAKMRPVQARAEASAFESRLSAYRANPLIREAGRLEHMLKLVRKLVENCQLHPLDPALDSPLRP
jgi:membrane protease subunit HflK